ncbi:MAG: 50S ribosomal protein L25/general stress protein Ctc [Gammaproteobacteria bacterium]|nr:MAG: 50S ribosomal protein L25/general stress protein Ctc [Gammaproteobacteria bacterium]
MSTNHQFELNAEIREVFGSGASRRLRRLENRVPAILYGASEPPLPVSLEHNQILRALENEAFYSHILTIKLDGIEQKAVLKDLQRHAYKPRILHVDLMRVSAKDKITMSVPLHFKGEADAPGAKDEGGVLTKLLTSVEVRCLPAALPEYIEVDVSHLGLDESILLSQINLPKGVELTAAISHEDDRPVVNIHIPRAVVEEEDLTAAPESAEVPAINVKDDVEHAAGEDKEKAEKDKK